MGDDAAEYAMCLGLLLYAETRNYACNKPSEHLQTIMKGPSRCGGLFNKTLFIEVGENFAYGEID